MLKAKSTENFLSRNLQNFDLVGGLEIRSMKSCDFFTAKGTSLNHFACRLVGGAGKVKKSREALIGMACRR